MEKVIKPWGHYEVLLDEPNYKVKRLYLKPNCSFSYQYHNHRKEFWVVTEGSGIVITDGSEYNANPEDLYVITETSPHRATAGDEGMTIIETQTGECREDDIVRLLDDYGRVGTIT